MKRTTPLDRYFNELCPDFRIESWTPSDSSLSEASEMFLNNPSTLDLQGRYLAEAIYLDSLKQSDVDEGIERYIKRYTSKNYGSDPVRVAAINHLCRDASTNHENVTSQTLIELLTERCVTAPANHNREPLPLNCMKDVQESTRFGGIVFLPKDAEVIVIGDTHGDLASTRHIINEIKTSGALDRGAYAVFLGDYTSNGVRSWQNLAEILSFQQEHPDSVVLLSGNHEFRESYITVLNEYLSVHWDRFTVTELPDSLQDRLPKNDNHYGHLRLELVRSFGFAEGERIYSMCAEWGLTLPYICISDNLMISHSLGKLDSELELAELLYSKQHDIDSIRLFGYEVWQMRRASLHSALINNREISAQLLSDFSQVLNVDQFVVGHCHYRSGDTLHLGDNTVTTIVSSEPFSLDSGHYMYQQMMLERSEKRHVENLTAGDAVAGYLLFSAEKQGERKMRFSKLTASV